MTNFQQRILTGSLYTALVAVSLIVSPYFYGIVFGALMILSLVEFHAMQKNNSTFALSTLSIVVGFFFFILTFLHAYGKIENHFFIIVPTVILFFIILVLFQNTKIPVERLGLTFFGLMYLCIPFILLNYLVFKRSGIFEGTFVLGIFILIWVYDSGAYVFGLWLGKKRLFERISPKKSWEGAIGGFIMSIAAVVWLPFFFIQLSLIQRIVLAVLVSVSATLGDLSESMLKRATGIKDSGKILPGHGGALDRIDSVLFAIPVVFTYIKLIEIIRK